jgi:hypothetical protein
MGKLSPAKLEKLIKQGRMVPIIQQKGKEYYLVGYRRKATSRKNDTALLPEPQLIQVPNQK